MSEPQYGGQAVIEGVMMRGKDRAAIAVRKPTDEIVVERIHLRSIGERFPFLKWPFIRGVVALISSLTIGVKSLTYSANEATEEEEEISPWEMALSVVISFALAILLFVAFPAGVIALIQPLVEQSIVLNIIEGLVKITAFLTYLFIISRMKEVKRVFMYHGAEHKVIHNYESNLPLTVENARKFSTLHPRCGTNFIFLVILLSIFFFSFFGRPPFLERILYHLLLLPIIAGVSYEIIKLAGRDKVNPFIRCIATPGLWLQKLTTVEPDDSMLEVAIAALKAVLPEEERNGSNV
ncbi:DUF1385 domain-containing protein [Halothermothrix orenii]|uniref:Predicted metal-dependent enzyme n=1 Tax=Halothermothrix orenii (strain H 168 / OCM 544 / DSM 9562) TaxID=373903 RepID=B8CZ28_HALOH|nr:DUF1385 domain-containing protein [Halothermothrix orenii]ACL70547.1 predicted metal-dependent enzyme [Halothermothrix orenii H 168]